MEVPRLYSANETAALIGCSAMYLGVYIRAGLITPTATSCRAFLFDKDAVEAARIAWEEIKATAPKVSAGNDAAQNMAELFRGGKTLEEIGADYGITRERVRQKLFLLGITGKDGGRAFRKASATALRSGLKVSIREDKCQKFFGCSYDEYCKLTGLASVRGPVARSGYYGRQMPLLSMFWNHKQNAQRSCVQWKLSLPEYAEIVAPYLGASWRRSRLVLGRKDKNGSFSKDNVEIVGLVENSRRTQQQVQAERRKERVLELHASGLTPTEIVKATRFSLVTVNQYIYSEKNRLTLEQV